MMKLVCAWYQPVMEFLGGDSEQVSHGICPPCYNNVMANLGSASKAPKDRVNKVSTEKRTTGRQQQPFPVP